MAFVLDCFCAWKFLFCQASGSHLISQYFGLSTGIHDVISKCNLSNMFWTHAASNHYTPTYSILLHCQDRAFTVVILARFTLNMLESIWATHPSHLSWSQRSTECALNIHQVSFCVLFFTSLILTFFAKEQARFLFWTQNIHRGMSELSQKLHW